MPKFLNSLTQRVGSLAAPLRPRRPAPAPVSGPLGGFDIPEDVLNRDREERWEKSDAVEAAWVTIYQNPHDHWDLYELAEKLVDLEYHFQRWRFGHLKTVERIIGFKKGTGGTSGVGYLEGVLKEVFFPELLSVRTAL